MEISAYLQRINYHGDITPSAETLRDLHIAHMLSVPFENLDIHLKRPIVLTDDALFNKIVKERRGGFCYELNGLFAALLRELGFHVTMISANVASGKNGYSPDFDHMALKVSLAQDWLADVGFGDSFIAPLLLDETSEQAQGDRVYRVLHDGQYLIVMQNKKGNGWESQYRFTNQSYQYHDFQPRCQFHQTSPESHFMQGRICTRATNEGRITISEMRLITTLKNGDKQEQTIADNEEYERLLYEHFGLNLKADL